MEALPEPPVARVHAHLRARLRVLDQHDAHVGKVGLTRVPEPHGHQVVLPVQAVHGPVPPRQADEVRDQEDQRAPLDAVVGRLEQLRQVGHRPSGRGLLSVNVVDEAEHLVAAAAGRNRKLAVVVVEDSADTVPVSREQARHQRHEVDHDRLLATLLRPEGHRGAQIEQEPGRDLPVLRVLAHVWHVHPRRHVPVDMADVVRRLVLPQLGEV